MENKPLDDSLVKNLENVFTIDGRGRPKKCQLLLELLKTFPISEVMKEIQRMSERNSF